MDRLTSVQWLRMKADGFYNVYEQERFTEAADEIERLREALNEAETICLAQYVTLMCAGENEKASNVKKVADKLTTLLKKESE